MMGHNYFRYKKLLIGYWILIPILYFLYIYLAKLNQNTTYFNILTSQPIYSIYFLLAWIMIIQALLVIKARDEIMNKYIRIFLFQQIMTLNIIGVILNFLLLKKCPQNGKFISKEEGFIFKISIVFIIVVSIISLFAFLRIVFN